jgi:hypothetical protein
LSNGIAKETAKAITALVKAAKAEHKTALIELMKSKEFLDLFEYDTNRKQLLAEQPFSVLLRDIATLNTDYAEELLNAIADDDLITGKLRDGGGAQGYYRSIALVESLGYLVPKKEQTYNLLSDCLSKKTRVSSGTAYKSLLQIGNDQAVAILETHDIFPDPKKYRDQSYTLIKLADIGMHRNRVANFELLLKLSGKAPTASLRVSVLRALTEVKPWIDICEISTPNFPSYALISQEKRNAMKNILSSHDTTKYEKEAVQQLEKLKKMLD